MAERTERKRAGRCRRRLVAIDTIVTRSARPGAGGAAISRSR
jgi:hypothetical protein